MNVINPASQMGSGEIRILALSGGGARGIFQARLIQRIETEFSIRIIDNCSHIAGVSTGSITAAALAVGARGRDIYHSFTSLANLIFRRKLFAAIRSGPRYSQDTFRRELASMLGDYTFDALPIELIIPASSVDTHNGRVFTKATDPRMLVIDAVLASTAAPTYFAPWRVRGDARAYYDGGLWANSPGAVALRVATTTTEVCNVRLLSIGTGKLPSGSNPAQLDRIRTLSIRTIQFLLDIVPSLRDWDIAEQIKWILSSTQWLDINPVLRRWIPLDDVKASLEDLPALADQEFEKHREELRSFFAPPISPAVPVPNPVAAQGVALAGLSRFTSSRRDYAKFRPGRESITGYVSSAQYELVMISINLMTGYTIESLTQAFRQMILERSHPVTIRISLLNPKKEYLMRSVAGNFEHEGDYAKAGSELAQDINRILDRLKKFHDSLEDRVKGNFQLFVHNTIPSASAILIDPAEPSGSIQLETKAYGTPAMEAYGFEVAGHTSFYKSLWRAYNKLIDHGERLV